MNICIVTVYDSINSGSFWQAYALGYVLNEMGHSVYYYKRPINGTASSSVISQLWYILKHVLKLKFASSINYIKMLEGFKKEQKKFKVINKNSPIFTEIDCFILGSDTIFNIDSKYFLNNYKIFWGGIFLNKKTVCYAASAANTSLEKCLKLANLSEYIQNWSYIGVRDVHTKKLIHNFTDKPIKIVCDPTLLLSKDNYRSLVSEPKEKHYIFLYLFNRLTEQQIKELKQFAKEKKLLIINGTSYSKYSYWDKSIVNIPSNFLKYMLFADYIITDTFHGTVFSVNLEKKFVAIDRGKNKVNDFLHYMKLEDRKVSCSGTFHAILSQNINYEAARMILENFRNVSVSFLRQALGEEK